MLVVIHVNVVKVNISMPTLVSVMVKQLPLHNRLVYALIAHVLLVNIGINPFVMVIIQRKEQLVDRLVLDSVLLHVTQDFRQVVILLLMILEEHILYLMTMMVVYVEIVHVLLVILLMYLLVQVLLDMIPREVTPMPIVKPLMKPYVQLYVTHVIVMLVGPLLLTKNYLV